MNYLLSSNINPNDVLDIGDALSYGGSVLLLGMATVFAVLIIIWLALILFKFFFHDLKLGVKIEKEKPVASVADPTPVVVRSAANDEIVAVIAAAIAMAESEAPAGAKFRVVSFKRK